MNVAISKDELANDNLKNVAQAEKDLRKERDLAESQLLKEASAT